MTVTTIEEKTSESRKRLRIESSDKANDEKPTPAYGSQEYWEKRYETKDEQTSNNDNEDDPEPYHAWYFKFDDLAPILLPLIVGTAEYEETSEDIGEDEESDPQQGIEEDINPINNIDNENEEKKDANKSPDDEQKDTSGENDNDEEGSDEEEIEGFEIIEMEEDDDGEDANSIMVRHGLSKKSPISVLEVGCGDAPLGQDLATSIQAYGSKSGTDPSKIIEKIVCLDYSKNVIASMKQEMKNETGIPVLYEVGDARDLSYKNASFEIILEKGTLDAMLSDSDGVSNCRKIVAECARLLTIGGYFVIISHLNAHVESGLEWLNNVVVPGLRAAAAGNNDFEWLIEVHGSDVEIPSDDEDEEKEIESPGPAVYFIEKVGLAKQQETKTRSDDQEKPTIPLKFFSY